MKGGVYRMLTMNQRLPFIISRKKFKRHTQEELAKAYRELNEYPD